MSRELKRKKPCLSHEECTHRVHHASSYHAGHGMDPAGCRERGPRAATVRWGPPCFDTCVAVVATAAAVSAVAGAAAAAFFAAFVAAAVVVAAVVASVAFRSG